MQYTILLASLSALAIASPVVNIARQASGTAPYPFAAASGIATPSGTGISAPIATSTGSAPCAVDGKLICNGPGQYGKCDWGSVLKWQDVAAGTVCINGEIGYASNSTVSAGSAIASGI